MSDRKHKMNVFQLVLAILLTLAVVALIGYGYYKQSQVIDRYEKIYGDDTNTVEQEPVETEEEKIEITKDLVAKLFPLGNVKYSDNAIISFDLVDFYANTQTKKTFLNIGVKEVKLNDIDASKKDYINRIITVNPKIEKDGNNYTLSYYVIYLRDLGDYKKEDGTTTRLYAGYQKYNYQTNSFLGRLTDTIYASDLYSTIESIDSLQFDKHIISYKYSEQDKNYSYVGFKVE